MVVLKTEVEQHPTNAISRKEKIKAMIISAANSAGQEFYFNYANLVAVGMSATPIQISIITGIQNLGTNLFQGFFGRLSDRLGRKIVLILGFIIATITTAFLAFNSSTIVFMIIIALYSLGISMVIPSWNALLGDISTKKTRVKVIGQLGMVGTISASVILLVLGFLTDYLPFPENFLIFSDKLTDYNYRFMIFCGSFIFAFAAIVVVTLTETNLLKKKNKLKSIREITKDKPFAVLITVTLAWWFVMSFLWPLFPYVLKIIDPTNAQIAILSAVFSASMALSQISIRKIADKIGRRMTMFVGIISLCMVPLVLVFSTEWYLVIIANIFGGLGNGAIMVSISAEILDLAGPEAKGAYSGAFNLMLGIATFCGSFLCGVIFEFFTDGYVYSDNEFYIVLRIFLIGITIVRILASIPILIYALKKRKQ